MLLACAGLSACDGFGGIFAGGSSSTAPPPPPPPSKVATSPPVAGGISLPGPPRTVTVGPTSGATDASATTPVVVVFSESVNVSTVTSATMALADTSGSTVSGTFLFYAGQQVVVFLPDTSLAAGTTYELTLTDGVGDLDGERVALSGGATSEVVTSFTVAVASAAPRILARFPGDGAAGVDGRSEILAVFSEALDPGSLVPSGEPGATFAVSEAGAVIPGQACRFAADRVVVFTPFAPGAACPAPVPSGTFGAGSQVTVDLKSGLQTQSLPTQPFLGTGSSTFTVSPLPSPSRVELFDDPSDTAPAGVINASTAGAFQVDVAIDAGALASDTIQLQFADLSGTVVSFTALAGTDGPGVVSVTPLSLLDAAAAPILPDGTVVLGASLSRGTIRSAMAVASPDLRQDTVVPQFTGFGPPTGTNQATVYTTLRKMVLTGSSSETLTDLLLDGISSLGATSVLSTLFYGKVLDLGLVAGGSTVVQALPVDAAGNAPAAATPVTLVQRGVVGGGPNTGPLTVLVYDAHTLNPIPGAIVVVEPGFPSLPASSLQDTATTLSDGTAAFSTSGGPQTVTAMHLGAAGIADYFGATVVAADAGWVSLPLLPRAATEAQVAVTLLGTTAQEDVSAGGNLWIDRTDPFLDPLTLDTFLSGVTPITNLLPNRLLAFTGVQASKIPPAGLPSFNNFDAVIPLDPPVLAAAQSSTLNVSFPPDPNRNSFADDDIVPLSGTMAADGTGMGFVASGKPDVRIMARLDGFEGRVPIGVGVATATATGWDAQSSFPNGFAESTANPAVPPGLGVQPVYGFWVEARGAAGEVSRAVVSFLPPAAPAAATLPAAPIVSLPDCTYPQPVVWTDTIDDAGGGQVGLYVLDVTTPTASGDLGWILYVPDQPPDGNGENVLQLPDLSGIGSEPIAKSGIVRFQVDAYTMPAGFDGNAFLLSDLCRDHVGFARATASCTAP